MALSTISTQPLAEADYDEIHAALRQTERGRWFLTEYARRNRNADTEILLQAIARIEAAVRGDHPRPPADTAETPALGRELAAIAEVNVEVQDHCQGGASTAVDVAEQPETSAAASGETSELPPPAPFGPGAMTAEGGVEKPADNTLLAPGHSAGAVAALPVAEFSAAPADAASAPPQPLLPPRSGPNDPLAAVHALSEEEKIALST
jgi:hypothetical protein